MVSSCRVVGVLLLTFVVVCSCINVASASSDVINPRSLSWERQAALAASLYTGSLSSNFTCRPNASLANETCNGHGRCEAGANGTFHCNCEDKYAGKTCATERKSNLVAFLLSFFVGGWGADRFYLGYNAVGGVKLALGLCVCCLSFCGRLLMALFCNKNSGYESLNGEGEGGVGTFLSAGMWCLSCLGFLAVAGWWLADVILIGTGDLDDYDGYSMYKDM